MKVHRKIDAFRGDAALSSWIYRITFNTAMSRLRSARAEPRDRSAGSRTSASPEQPDRQPSEPADWSSLADDQVLRGQMRERLIASLTHLPEVYRVPVILRDIQGLSTEEASAVLEVKPQTLKSRLHRGRLMLREHLADFAGGVMLHAREVTRASAEPGSAHVSLRRRSVRSRSPSAFAPAASAPARAPGSRRGPSSTGIEHDRRPHRSGVRDHEAREPAPRSVRDALRRRAPRRRRARTGPAATGRESAPPARRSRAPASATTAAARRRRLFPRDDRVRAAARRRRAARLRRRTVERHAGERAQRRLERQRRRSDHVRARQVQLGDRRRHQLALRRAGEEDRRAVSGALTSWRTSARPPRPRARRSRRRRRR